MSDFCIFQLLFLLKNHYIKWIKEETPKINFKIFSGVGGQGTLSNLFSAVSGSVYTLGIHTYQCTYQFPIHNNSLQTRLQAERYTQPRTYLYAFSYLFIFKCMLWEKLLNKPCREQIRTCGGFRNNLFKLAKTSQNDYLELEFHYSDRYVAGTMEEFKHSPLTSVPIYR